VLLGHAKIESNFENFYVLPKKSDPNRSQVAPLISDARLSVRFHLRSLRMVAPQRSDGICQDVWPGPLRCKTDFQERRNVRPAINVSGLLVEHICFGPSWASARIQATRRPRWGSYQYRGSFLAFYGEIDFARSACLGLGLHHDHTRGDTPGVFHG